MLGLKEVIKLGSNENPLGPSPKAVEAIRLAAAAMHRYPSVHVDDLRCRLAESVGSGLGAENVIVGNGSADIILSLARTYLQRGEEWPWLRSSGDGGQDHAPDSHDLCDKPQ